MFHLGPVTRSIEAVTEMIATTKIKGKSIFLVNFDRGRLEWKVELCYYLYFLEYISLAQCGKYEHFN